MEHFRASYVSATIVGNGSHSVFNSRSFISPKFVYMGWLKLFLDLRRVCRLTNVPNDVPDCFQQLQLRSNVAAVSNAWLKNTRIGSLLAGATDSVQR